jgi:hypothetical protein
MIACPAKVVVMVDACPANTSASPHSRLAYAPAEWLSAAPALSRPRTAHVPGVRAPPPSGSSHVPCGSSPGVSELCATQAYGPPGSTAHSVYE